jgi:hypothetical protein
VVNAVGVEYGGRNLGKSMPGVTEIRGRLREAEADSIVSCLAARGRALGLDDSSINMLRGIGAARYGQAANEFGNCGLSERAQSVSVKAHGASVTI